MSPDKKPNPSKPLKFGEPEKTDWKKRALVISFVVLAIAGIIAMLVTNPREKRLNCSSGPSSLTSFGTCTEE